MALHSLLPVQEFPRPYGIKDAFHLGGESQMTAAGVVSTAANPPPGVRMFVVWPW